MDHIYILTKVFVQESSFDIHLPYLIVIKNADRRIQIDFSIAMGENVSS
jgi:hypothetical protein